ncbi:hypothetical protein F4677DRAFT_414299 [Hypoxylon crocopeplum]|nr:hypothetical protein F4677DRAFT_414299 [Hypoxylon crocopeplum]
MEPAAAIPPDENRGPIINIIGWVGAGLSTLFVALRLYSRLVITRSAGWDDVIIIVAAISNIVTAALCSMAISYGMGRHTHYLSDSDISNSLLYSAIQRPTGVLSYCLPKLAVVILLIKLMGPPRRGPVLVLYSVLVVLFVTSILATIIPFTQCNPTNHLWNPSSPADCFPDIIVDVISYIAACWSGVADVVLASFPIYLLWNLQMKRSRKISAMMIMALGFFASIFAITKATQLGVSHSKDGTWDAFWFYILAYLEVDFVIIAACAPALPKLIRRMLGREEAPSQPRYPPVAPTSQGYQPFGSHHELFDMRQK